MSGGSLNELSGDLDQLIDGDDDLLDYFLGADNASGQAAGAQQGGNVPMEEVQSSMASLFKTESGSLVSGSPLLYDNTLMDEGALSPPVDADFSLNAPSPDLINNQAAQMQHQLPGAPGWTPELDTAMATKQKKSGGSGGRAKTKAGRGGRAGASARSPKTKAGSGSGGGGGRAKSSGSAASAPGQTKGGAAKSKGAGRGRAVKQEPVSASNLGGGGLDASGAGGDENSEEKRLRRLARNRESARQSRRRKKEHLELLEDRVTQLSTELDQLRREHLEDANRALQQRRRQMLDDLNAQAGNMQGAALREHLLSVVEKTGPASPERQVLLNHQYRTLFNLLLPPYTKFMLWIMNQGDSFFDEKPAESARGGSSKGETGLWALVSNELGLSQDQQEKLRAYYKQHDDDKEKQERTRLSICIEFLRKMRANVATRSKTVETHTRALLGILTPEQALRYMTWIEYNRDALDRCGVGETLLFSDITGGGMGDASAAMSTDMPALSDNPNFVAARDILRKPEEDMTMQDLQKLIEILDSF